MFTDYRDIDCEYDPKHERIINIYLYVLIATLCAIGLYCCINEDKSNKSIPTYVVVDFIDEMSIELPYSSYNCRDILHTSSTVILYECGKRDNTEKHMLLSLHNIKNIYYK